MQLIFEILYYPLLKIEEKRKLKIDEVNSLPHRGFIKIFGNVVEHNPLAASAVYATRPFKTFDDVRSKFETFLTELSQDGENTAPKPNTNVNIAPVATNPVNTTSAPSVPSPGVHKFDLGSGYEIFFDGRFISFKPIANGQASGKPGAPQPGQSSLGMLLSGQGGSLELTLKNKTKTIGGAGAPGAHGAAGWAGGPTTEPALGPSDRMNTTDVPEEIEARPDKRAYIMPMQNYNLPLGYLAPRERPSIYTRVTAMPSLSARPGVAGWAQNPTTTEPALGPHDRINTTDVPEEIEARPDKTRAQRRALLRRMNPGFTDAQIEAQLVRDDKARAKLAAQQGVVLLPELVTPPTPPPPKVKLNAAKKPAPGAKPRQVFRARRKKKPNNVVSTRKQSQQPQPRPRPRTTTTPEPTYPPTYPTTTQYYPTTYPTPANSYQYNTGPRNNQYQQQQFRPAQQYQPPRRQRQFQQQQQYQPTGPPPRQQRQRPVRPRRRQQQQRRNGRPQGPPIERQQRPRTTTDREEIPARDRLARWFLNNIDIEVLDTFLPLFAMG